MSAFMKKTTIAAVAATYCISQYGEANVNGLMLSKKTVLSEIDPNVAEIGGIPAVSKASLPLHDHASVPDSDSTELSSAEQVGQNEKIRKFRMLQLQGSVFKKWKTAKLVKTEARLELELQQLVGQQIVGQFNVPTVQEIALRTAEIERLTAARAGEGLSAEEITAFDEQIAFLQAKIQSSKDRRQYLVDLFSARRRVFQANQAVDLNERENSVISESLEKDFELREILKEVRNQKYYYFEQCYFGECEERLSKFTAKVKDIESILIKQKAELARLVADKSQIAALAEAGSLDAVDAETERLKKEIDIDEIEHDIRIAEIDLAHFKNQIEKETDFKLILVEVAKAVIKKEAENAEAAVVEAYKSLVEGQPEIAKKKLAELRETFDMSERPGYDGLSAEELNSEMARVEAEVVELTEERQKAVERFENPYNDFVRPLNDFVNKHVKHTSAMKEIVDSQKETAKTNFENVMAELKESRQETTSTETAATKIQARVRGNQTRTEQQLVSAKEAEKLAAEEKIVKELETKLAEEQAKRVADEAKRVAEEAEKAAHKKEMEDMKTMLANQSGILAQLKAKLFAKEKEAPVIVTVAAPVSLRGSAQKEETVTTAEENSPDNSEESTPESCWCN